MSSTVTVSMRDRPVRDGSDQTLKSERELKIEITLADDISYPLRTGSVLATLPSTQKPHTDTVCMASGDNGNNYYVEVSATTGEIIYKGMAHPSVGMRVVQTSAEDRREMLEQLIFEAIDQELDPPALSSAHSNITYAKLLKNWEPTNVPGTFTKPDIQQTDSYWNSFIDLYESHQNDFELTRVEKAKSRIIAFFKAQFHFDHDRQSLLDSTPRGSNATSGYDETEALINSAVELNARSNQVALLDDDQMMLTILSGFIEVFTITTTGQDGMNSFLDYAQALSECMMHAFDGEAHGGLFGYLAQNALSSTTYIQTPERSEKIYPFSYYDFKEVVFRHIAFYAARWAMEESNNYFATSSTNGEKLTTLREFSRSPFEKENIDVSSQLAAYMIVWEFIDSTTGAMDPTHKDEQTLSEVTDNLVDLMELIGIAHYFGFATSREWETYSSSAEATAAYDLYVHSILSELRTAGITMQHEYVRKARAITALLHLRESTENIGVIATHCAQLAGGVTTANAEQLSNSDIEKNPPGHLIFQMRSYKSQ